jgi:hypothetical protein
MSLKLSKSFLDFGQKKWQGSIIKRCGLELMSVSRQASPRFLQRLYSKRNMVYGPMHELTIIKPHIDSKIDSDAYAMSYPTPNARVDLHPAPESTLCPNQELRIYPLCQVSGIPIVG